MNIFSAVNLGNFFVEIMVQPIEVSGISKVSVGEMRDHRLGKFLRNQ